ncbi:MAG TPA: ATP-binding protein [Bryobacteraceae bacterium]|nr:ATP-binding protein [Bryobacteraceae bacterium]
MVRFRDVSIRHKLLFINVLTTGVALLMASTAFITYERLRFQEDVSRQLTTIADVLATSAGPALATHNPAAGENVLHALFAEPRILAACLDLPDGGALVCHGNSGMRADNGDLLLSRPIIQKGQKLGVIWIRFDGRVSFEALRHDMAMVSLAMAVCFIIAILLSSRLQRTISGPVLRLAATAREVAVGRNYSIRAEKSGRDELGLLVDSFNEMLAQLGEHAAELRAIYDSAIHAIVTVTADGAVTAWNRGAESIFGFSEPLAVGQQFRCFLAEVSRSACAAELERVHASSDACAEGKLLELVGLRKDGTEFPVGATITPWSSTKGTLYTIFMRDASERQLLEVQLAQAQKLESIGQLAAGVAHEINTPIQYVGDNTRFLEDSFRNLDRVLTSYDNLTRAAESAGILPDEVQQVHAAAEEADLEYLHDEIPRAIRQSGEGVERVATIVKAMKEFSHPGSGGMKAIDLNHAIESTLTVSRNEWKYVADAVTEFDPHLPVVRCLPGEFNQVILNLVVNAAHAIADVKMRGTTKGRITVSTRRDGDWAEIRVRDTGTGIPEAVRSRIFTPFFTTKEVGRGTGQGLAIAHTVVVKKHGGTLEFETEEGKGTTFIIRMPIAGAAPGKS